MLFTFPPPNKFALIHQLPLLLQTTFELNPERAVEVSKLFRPIELRKRDLLQTEGGAARQLVFLQEGYVRLFFTVDGRESTQWISGPNYLVMDLSSFMNRQPARFTIEALTAVRGYAIDRSQYDQIGQIAPEWSRAEARFLLRCFVTLENRVRALISLPAEARYHQFFELFPELFNRVPLRYLASVLGMTPETLSRLRANS